MNRVDSIVQLWRKKQSGVVHDLKCQRISEDAVVNLITIGDDIVKSDREGIDTRE